MIKMGKASIQNGECKMDTEKVQGNPSTFSALGIGSSVVLYYICD